LIQTHLHENRQPEHGAKLMKTKAERESSSKKRQKVGREMAVWAQKIKDLEPHPERDPALDFAKAELKKCRDAMQRLNIGEKRQRCWASGPK
jgi:hypothetical protein